MFEIILNSSCSKSRPSNVKEVTILTSVLPLVMQRVMYTLSFQDARERILLIYMLILQLLLIFLIPASKVALPTFITVVH